VHLGNVVTVSGR